jgi:hypothetical protein
MLKTRKGITGTKKVIQVTRQSQNVIMQVKKTGNKGGAEQKSRDSRRHVTGRNKEQCCKSETSNEQTNKISSTYSNGLIQKG